MRVLLILLFLLTSFFATAQIIGNIFNEEGKPVKFATVYNSNKNTSAITNANGLFQLEGKVGDSIVIRHLNYQDRTEVIQDFENNYRLTTKVFNLGEVNISADYAARLFETACKKTYEKLKEKNVSRGYLRNMKIVNSDTTCLIDLDLDIVQRKPKSHHHKQHISPYKVQERIIRDATANRRLKSRVLIFPDFGTINWIKFNSYFNYYKLEDSEHIRLYFCNKKSLNDSINHIEVIINKEDTCLSVFSLISRNPIKNRKGDLLVDRTLSYMHLNYGFRDGFSYISRLQQGYIFTDKERGKISLLQCFKSYENGSGDIERRPNGHKIFDNFLEPHKIQCKYDEEFWKQESYPKSLDYDYTPLLNLEFGEMKH